ncbi:NAD-dependent epimerase/dehydratase family protein [Alsobacter sp. SYSU BS001988]
MDVLVAGGAGFLGSHLVDRLLQRDEITRLVVLDNLWTGTRCNLRYAERRGIIFVHEDVEHFSSSVLFDEIYHLASPASPSWYMKDPIKTVTSNVLGALRLLDLLKPGGLFCFTSTSEVYGDPLVSPQPETYRGSVDCTGPRSSYDESKRCVESILFEARRVHGTRVKVVRLFNVYGPRTKIDDGRAISNFIAQAMRGGPLTIYGNGLQSRSWGYVDDIISGLERYFWRDRTEYPGPLNIGNDREVSVIDVARFIQSCFPQCAILHASPAPQDPSNRCPDLSLASTVLPGWSCKVPFEEGVIRTIAWFRDNQISDRT